MSLLAILGVIFGLKQIAQDGISVLPIVTIVGGIILGAIFVRRQLHIESPVFDVRLFRIRAFSASLGTYLLAIFVVVGFFLFIGQYLQLVLGLSPFVAAMWSLPPAIGFIAGSVIAPRIIHRYPPATVMGAGVALAAVGSTLLLGVGLDPGLGLPLVVIADVILSLALAPVITLATELIVGSAPPEQVGAATGMSETSGELGGALGIAILGSLGTAVYRAGVTDLAPAGLAEHVLAAARDTLGGAVAIAQTLPQALGAQLVSAASAAFIDAFHVVTAVSVVGALLTAVAAYLALRGVPARTEPEPADSELTPIKEAIG
jgi:DHA2 family multidrug resistance protein-like MFS transporter